MWLLDLRDSKNSPGEERSAWKKSSGSELTEDRDVVLGRGPGDKPVCRGNFCQDAVKYTNSTRKLLASFHVDSRLALEGLF